MKLKSKILLILLAGSAVLASTVACSKQENTVSNSSSKDPIIPPNI